MYFLGDYLHAEENLTIQSMMGKFGDQKILFADVVEKVNKLFKVQESAFTDEYSCIQFVAGKIQNAASDGFAQHYKRKSFYHGGWVFCFTFR